MKNYLWKIMIVMFILVMSTRVTQAVDNTPPAGALEAAKAAVSAFLGNSDQEELSKFGFNNREEFNKANVGDAFNVHFLSPDAVLNTKHAPTLLSVSDNTNIWQFLVTTEQGAACLVTVDIVGNKWTATTVGGTGLAKQLYEMIQAWPKSSGYEVVLIKSLQARSDFIEVYFENKNVGIVTLTSANVALNRDNAESALLLKADDVLEPLAPIIRQNLIQSATGN